MPLFENECKNFIEIFSASILGMISNNMLMKKILDYWERLHNLHNIHDIYHNHTLKNKFSQYWERLHNLHNMYDILKNHTIENKYNLTDFEKILFKNIDELDLESLENKNANENVHQISS